MEGYKLDLVIVTGLSGAGKSQAADVLEDIGYYCIDNIPPMLIESIIDLGLKSQDKLSKIAVITDLRVGEMFNETEAVIERLKKSDINPKILFLDASDAVITRRYKENRRTHPLCNYENISILDAVKKERSRLNFIKSISDFVIDTTLLSNQQLKQRVLNTFLSNNSESMKVQCVSFGNKYGPFYEADLLFDVRCLPNPFYDETLKKLTGLDRRIKDYVLNSQESKEFVARLLSFIDYSLPLYVKEGKSQLIIAVGCTGGKHRSVTIAELICEHLKENDYLAVSTHRDIEK